MKVILLKDVKNVGKKNQTVEVSDGFGTNFLLPKGLAVIATKKSIEIRDQQKEDEKILQAKMKKEAEMLKERIEKITLEFTLKTGKDGRLFGSVTSKQVAEELKAKHNIVIDRRKIIEKDSVNTLGYTKLNIELYKGVIAEINVHVSEQK